MYEVKTKQSFQCHQTNKQNEARGQNNNDLTERMQICMPRIIRKLQLNTAFPGVNGVTIEISNIRGKPTA